MKKTAFISAFTLAGSLTLAAQGVLLNAGETLSLGFNGVEQCQFSEESFIGGRVWISLGVDALGAGESIRFAMFENNINEVPLAMQTYSGPTPTTVFLLQSPQSWLDYQGAMQITMLAGGSVVVANVRFDVLPELNKFCFTQAVIPEPATWMLLSSAALFFLIRRRRKPCTKS